MKNISLLPPEIKEQKKLRRKQQFYLVINAIFLIFFLFIYGSLLIMTAQERSLAARLEQQRQQLEDQAAGLEQYARMEAQAQEAEEILSRALGDVPDWRHILIDMSRSKPYDVWLSDLSADYQEEGGQITMQGWALRHGALASWLGKVEDLEGLTNIRLQYSRKTMYEESTVVEFEIRGSVEPGNLFHMLLERNAF